MWIYILPPTTKCIHLCVCVSPCSLPLSHGRTSLNQLSFFLPDKSDMAGWLSNRKPFHCSDLFLKENKTASILDHWGTSKARTPRPNLPTEKYLFPLSSPSFLPLTMERRWLPSNKSYWHKEVCSAYSLKPDCSHLEINGYVKCMFYTIHQISMPLILHCLCAMSKQLLKKFSLCFQNSNNFWFYSVLLLLNFQKRCVSIHNLNGTEGMSITSRLIGICC